MHDRDQIAVSFAGVTKRYGATAALEGVSFQVSQGEMVAVLGPNGAGKSTGMAGLTDLADRRVQHLSGGQAQRVRLAVALAGRPEVLFLDEPTVGLDAEARRGFWQGVHTVAGEGATVLFATHYLQDADANATRVLVVVAGRLAADGTPASVKARLAEKTVKATLARACPETLRRLPGVVAARADGSAVELAHPRRRRHHRRTVQRAAAPVWAADRGRQPGGRADRPYRAGQPTAQRGDRRYVTQARWRLPGSRPLEERCSRSRCSSCAVTCATRASCCS